MIEYHHDRALVVFTDRHGGESNGPFASANLADHVGDLDAAVRANRRRLANELQLADPAQWVWLRQQHGANVHQGGLADPRPVADAAITEKRGVPLVVLTADCAPVALISGDGIAVVHAGWAGLLAGVVAQAIGALRARSSGAIRAVLGPCIHPQSYEFGEEQLGMLADRFGPEVCATTRWGTPAFDLPRAVHAALREDGVTQIHDVNVCTFESEDHFSYRRDGVTGRQAMVAWREP